ncbi:MAG: fimbrillin family protein [Bacteroidales bacterium]|nr:fimbrillin family protein [Bacteroidales bacterium]
MKKFFFLAAAVLVALAACTKNTIDTSDVKEISYNAVTGKNASTKAIINSTFYAPTDPAFGIWGLYQTESWSANHSASVWVGASASAATQITYDLDSESTANSEAWRNASSVDYWPLTGSLVFMGYSPYANVSSKAAISVTDNKATLTVTNFQTTTGNWVDDLMWSDAVEKSANDTNYDADGTNATTYNGVPVVFHHALSQISIFAKTDKDYAALDYTFTITALSVTVDDNATLTVADDLSADPTVTWTEPATDATRTVLSAASPALTTSFVKQGDSFLVIPQTLTAAQDIITVTYQVVHNGVTSTATKNISLTAGDSVALSAFAKNTKYNLNLVFSIDEIKYSPDIIDWEATSSSEYEVPQDAISS